jgi:hypothetical protein
MKGYERVILNVFLTFLIFTFSILFSSIIYMMGLNFKESLMVSFLIINFLAVNLKLYY